MARPKLNDEEKKISVSFALNPEFHQMLLDEIPPGKRSEWLCGVVIAALKEFKELAVSEIE